MDVPSHNQRGSLTRQTNQVEDVLAVTSTSATLPRRSTNPLKDLDFVEDCTEVASAVTGREKQQEFSLADGISVPFILDRTCDPDTIDTE